MTLPVRLIDTTQADIECLIASGATEGPHQDFKRDFPTRWDNETKARVLADVTSFANAGGGDVIYGVEEDGEARAAAIVPQTLANVDEEVRRLMDIALNQTEPRVPGVQVQPVPVTVGMTSGHVIVVRVPQSWAAPHRNRINQHFHVREGVRNRTLDVPEVRAQFLRTESQAQRLRDFRSERLAKIVTGQTPVQLTSAPKLVVHVISTQAALGQAHIDPVPYARRRQTLPVLGDNSASGIGLNLDGAYGSIPTTGRGRIGYTQQFRQGYFEAVWELAPLGDPPEPVLPCVAYERYVNDFLHAVRAQFAAHDVSQELILFLSLMGANRVKMSGPSELGRGYGSVLQGFDRVDVLLPEVLIEPEVSIGMGMRLAYDLMCQAAGYEGSGNYGEDGEWTSPR